MFEEIKSNFDEKKDKIEYLKKSHEVLMNAKSIGVLLKKSIIDNIVIENNGKMYIELNKNFNNIKLYINDDDFEEVPMSVICFGGYEIDETNMACKILDYYKKDDTFVVFDIGANVGWYSTNFFKKFNNVKVYSFEPSPITFNRLKENFLLNNISTENLYNIGFFNKNDKLEFFYDFNGSGGSSLANIRERDSVKKIVVNCEKIDDWTTKNNVSKVDFIKCDVEGAEFFVYQGGKEFLKKNKPIIFSEMLRKWSAKFGYHPNDIIDFMNELGYKCFTITDNLKLKECKRVDETTIETNYYFLHTLKHEKLINYLQKEL